MVLDNSIYKNKTNIAPNFLSLKDSTFASQSQTSQNFLTEASYSCMNNVKSIIIKYNALGTHNRRSQIRTQTVATQRTRTQHNIDFINMICFDLFHHHGVTTVVLGSPVC